MTTAGTPVQVTTTPTPCSSIRFEAVVANTGNVFVGTAGMKGSTLAGCVKQLQKPAAASPFLDYLEVCAGDGGNTLDASQFWIDAATNGDGVIVSYCQR